MMILDGKRSDFCFFALYGLGLQDTEKTKVYRDTERLLWMYKTC